MHRVRLKTLLGRLPSSQRAGKVIVPDRGKGSYRREGNKAVRRAQSEN